MRLGPALTVAAALALGGCFHPLYGTSSGGKNIAAEMQSIVVDPIQDRAGHYLGNALDYAFHGGTEGAPAKYHLIVTVGEGVQTAIIDSVQGRATAGTLMTNANYRLVPAGSETVLTSGTVTSMATYNRTEQRFANVRAAADAQIRNANSISDQLKTRIALYFSSRP